ncbi:MAG: SPFH domain-containing protein [Chloroflexota bacterium]
MSGALLIGGAIALVVIFLVVLVSRYYHQVPPSEVMVVFGGGGTQYVTDGGVLVVPVIQTFKRLDLRIITIKTEKDEVYTLSGVPIRLDWVSQVQVDSTDSGVRTAAKAFLDKTPDEIKQIIEETLSANFRAIVGQMTVEAIHRDRDEFVQRVQDLASDDVAAMGVKIISMGIEEITDEQGYLEAMAAPQIAAVKRDARIAEAEADREARVKAADAGLVAEQAEVDAQREILAQREALELREVQVKRQVGMSQAESDREVQKQRALAVEQQQEAEVLVPARAKREATEIEAEAERKRIEIEAEAKANATERTAAANAEATEKKGKADAAALRAQKEAEAAGERAKLLAEAEGRREIAAASAAEGEINLRQFVIEQVTQADIQKVQAIANALAGLGNNVRIVQFAGGENGNSHTGNTLMDMLMNIPELSEVFMAKTEALSGEDFEQTLMKASQLFNTLRTMQSDAPQLVDYSNEADDEEPPLPPEIEEISGENGVASS